MKWNRFLFVTVGIVLITAVMLLPGTVRAHCDTLDGPVVRSARAALEKGDVTPVLKWVRAEDEPDIRAAFDKTMRVREKGLDARELADLYFFETLVRIHRAGENAPYTGLKGSEAVDPVVVLADGALESGNVDQLIGILTAAMADGIRVRFLETLESRNHADESVEAGREFVRHYVFFTHYVEGLHTLIQGGAVHHGGGGERIEGGHGH
jgi:hypothetical protein